MYRSLLSRGKGSNKHIYTKYGNGNNRLKPIDSLTETPDTYRNIIRYQFTDIEELPIHGL